MNYAPPAAVVGLRNILKSIQLKQVTRVWTPDLSYSLPMSENLQIYTNHWWWIEMMRLQCVYYTELGRS